MKKLEKKALQDITVEDLERLAQEHSEPYEPMFKKVARYAFMQGVIWAQKYMKGGDNQ